MSLDTRNRPKSLATFAGSKSTVKAVKALFERRDKFPHAILITGPTGCGKTTLGRIIADQLGAKTDDYREVDSAQFNGIDTIRDIRAQTRFGPRNPESECRVWLIDECFPAGTLVSTPFGKRPIEDLYSGDYIYSLNGNDKVVAKMKKEIPLSRLTKLNFSIGPIITTKEHLFFTDKGWIKAEDLNSTFLIYLPNSYNMNRTNSVNNIIGEKDERNTTEMHAVRGCTYREGKMEQAKILFQSLFRKIFERASRNKEGASFEAFETKSCRFNKKGLGKNGPGLESKNSERILSKNEEKESIPLQKNYPENKRDKENKRDAEYMAREERRKWAFNRASNPPVCCPRMEDRTPRFARRPSSCWEEKRIHHKERPSDVLQVGCCKQGSENRNRVGWSWAQIESEYIKRSKENKSAKSTRLESSEVYQRGSNDGSFEGIIGDKERDCGFVTMYDLQVESHPSYFVNDIPVHNCHMLGVGGASEKNKTQNAILKMLEDAPAHVYFILCTTDPQRLLKTVVGRCVKFEVSTLADPEMDNLLKKVVRREKGSVSDGLREKIVDSAEGHPRNALKMLEKVIGLNDKDAEAVLEEQVQIEAQGVELCKALVAGKPWKVVAKILTGLKDQEEEGLRRLVLSWCNSILLRSGENPQAFVIMEEFEEPFYNTGKPGLTLACYRSVVTPPDDVPF